jgi:hypothetical protein
MEHEMETLISWIDNQLAGAQARIQDIRTGLRSNAPKAYMLDLAALAFAANALEEQAYDLTRHPGMMPAKDAAGRDPGFRVREAAYRRAARALDGIEREGKDGRVDRLEDVEDLYQ